MLRTMGQRNRAGTETTSRTCHINKRLHLANVHVVSVIKRSYTTIPISYPTMRRLSNFYSARRKRQHVFHKSGRLARIPPSGSKEN